MFLEFPLETSHRGRHFVHPSAVVLLFRRRSKFCEAFFAYCPLFFFPMLLHLRKGTGNTRKTVKVCSSIVFFWATFPLSLQKMSANVFTHYALKVHIEIVRVVPPLIPSG